MVSNKSLVAYSFQGFLTSAALLANHRFLLHDISGQTPGLFIESTSTIIAMLCIGYATLLLIIAKNGIPDSSFVHAVGIIVFSNVVLIICTAIMIDNPVIIIGLIVLILCCAFVLTIG